MQQHIGQFRDQGQQDDGAAVGPRSLAVPLLPHATRPTSRPTKTSRYDFGKPKVLWGVTGFVIGAIFWHFIGFWSFVSDVVLNSRVQVEERYVEQTGPRCIELVFDRKAGVTRGEPCAVNAPLLDERSLSAKGEFQGPRGKFARGGPAIRLSAGDR